MLDTLCTRRTLVAVVSVAAVTFGLTACGSSSSGSSGGGGGGASPASSPSGSGSSGGSYTIHAILSLTGTAAFLGSEERNALLALQDNVNSTGGIQGHKLKFAIADNQSTASTAVSLAASLRTMPLVIAGSVTTTDRPVDTLASSGAPVIYDLSPGDHPARGSSVFSASASTTAQTQAFVNFAQAKGWKHVAAITSTDASGQDGWEAIQKAIGATGGAISVTDHETFAPTDVSVTSQITRIESSHPQALFIWTTGTPLGTVLHAMQQAGYTSVPVMTTNGNASYAEMQKLAAVLPAQLYFPGAAFQLDPSTLPSPERQVVATFQSAMKSHGSVVPDEGNALAWDPGLVLVSALKKLGTKASASQIRSYINGLHSFSGVDGNYDFTSSTVAPDNRGIGASSVIITRWDTGKRRWLQASGPAGKTVKSP